uniref:hypothetical protein n=1 Tax=uncultured Draconibacterium sp. TaxID=1573823 RepID=UPI0032179F76
MKNNLLIEVVKLKSKINLIFALIGLSVYMATLLFLTDKVSTYTYYNTIEYDNATISVLILIFSIYIIFYNTLEFSQKTIFRMLFEGQSRTNYFQMKVGVMVLLCFILTVFTRLAVSIVLIFKGVEMNVLIHSIFNIYQILFVFLMFYTNGIFAMFLAALFKRGIWAITLLFSLVLINGLFYIVLLESGIAIPVSDFNKFFRYVGFIKSSEHQIALIFIFHCIIFYLVKSQYLKITWIKRN